MSFQSSRAACFVMSPAFLQFEVANYQINSPLHGLIIAPPRRPTEALQVIRDLPIVDELLERHAAVLGSNRRAYTNHVYRVVNLCAELAGHDADALQKSGIAGVFHDIGLFADGTFDYLEPSRTMCCMVPSPAVFLAARSARSSTRSQIAGSTGYW